MGLILDTNFVITAEREAKAGRGGKTDLFLSVHAKQRIFITFTVAGELACGRSARARRDWEKLCRPYPILPWTPEISWEYGEIYRELSSKGLLIGGNDMWIAATARVSGFVLVTNNLDEFRRVEGLQVVGY
jgi:predicted nucleic acid-binding protein